MGNFVFRKTAERKAITRFRKELNRVVQGAIIPYFMDEVRVDTGRLKFSIRAAYPDVDIQAKIIETEVLFGGTSMLGVYREVTIAREVDYVAELYTTPPAKGELQDSFNRLGVELTRYI